jgi:hypothetical protein
LFLQTEGGIFIFFMFRLIGEGAMKVVKTTVAIILFLSLCTAAYPLEAPGSAKGESASAPKKQVVSKDDDLLPFEKEGWRIVVAPYMWIPGSNLNINQGGVSTKADVPWWDIIPMLFSQAIGGMGEVEIWYNRWGFFSDTNFLYLSDSVSGGGTKELEFTPSNVPVTIPLRLDVSGNVKVWTRLLWQDVGVRRLVEAGSLIEGKRLPALSVELFGGLRYTYVNQDVKIELNATLTGPPGTGQITRGGASYTKSVISFIEPLAGLRLGLWMTPKLNLLLRADCGGWGIVAYNHVDTVFEALVGYRVTKRSRLYVGYRGRYASASTENSSVHGWFHGPMLGTVYSF